MDVFVLMVVKFLDLLVLVIIVDALASWFGNAGQVVRRYTGMVTQQLYRPIHMIYRPVFGGLDLTPLVVLLILNMMSGLLVKAMTG